MKKLTLLSELIVVALTSTAAFAGTDAPPDRIVESAPFSFSSPNIEVFFSPGDACVDVMVREISKAKSSICVWSAQLNLERVAGALAVARSRNVDVIILLDQAQVEGGSSATRTYLRKNDVRVLVDKQRPVDSNVVLIDNDVVLSGSGPFSVQATRVAGNLIVIRNNRKIANAYIEHWNSRMEQGRTAALSVRHAPIRAAARATPRRKIAAR
jgi:phosphatidylserine/phosphatidylglycerophosphate/cardiolipin synthase-like enzyme